MNQKLPIGSVATVSSNQCVWSGRPNLVNKELCAGCGSNLSLPLIVAKTESRHEDSSGEFGSLKVGLACVLAAVLALLLGFFLLHSKKSPEDSPEAITEADANKPETSNAEKEA